MEEKERMIQTRVERKREKEEIGKWDTSHWEPGGGGGGVGRGGGA